jgi:uncharacterized membrane protein
LGFVGVCGCCSFGFLVFVVIVLLGFVGIPSHVFLDSWCSWSLFSWVMLVFMVVLSLFLLLFMW